MVIFTFLVKVNNEKTISQFNFQDKCLLFKILNKSKEKFLIRITTTNLCIYFGMLVYEDPEIIEKEY